MGHVNFRLNIYRFGAARDGVTHKGKVEVEVDVGAPRKGRPGLAKSVR